MLKFVIVFLFFTFALTLMMLALIFSKYKKRGEHSCAHGHCITHLETNNGQQVDIDGHLHDHEHGSCHTCPERGAANCSCD